MKNILLFVSLLYFIAAVNLFNINVIIGVLIFLVAIMCYRQATGYKL